MIELIPPGLILLCAALWVAVVPNHWHRLGLFVGPVLTLMAIWSVPDGVSLTAPFLDYELQLIEASPERRLFATIFATMAGVGALYAFKHARRLELACGFAYASGAIGVSFAGDLITLFLFWELMALFSTLVVWFGGTAGARAAGIRYAIVHLLGGVILKVGIEGVVVHTGSIDIQALQANNFDTYMMLLGILINAAAPPVSAWLSDAYPEASPSGSLFLSAFTTKTAVLALILLFPGTPLLIYLGVFMIMYGIIWALLENNVRRILAFSIVNQVGFMVVAVGIGTPMALNGATAHAFAHIIYKALLFMSAGVVIYHTGKEKCNELGGLYRTMPLTAFCGIVGALAISSFPLTSGFTTKTMISEAAAMQNLVWVWYVLAAASAGVFLHAGIKFPWYVFFQKDSGLRPKDAPWNMAAAMLIFVGLCFGIGIYPEPFYQLLPYPTEFSAYKPGKVVFYLQLLLFSGLAFFLLLPLMKRTNTLTLDTDWFWRKLGAKISERTTEVISRGYSRASHSVGAGISAALKPILPSSDPSKDSVPAWSIGTTALWISTLLSAYVLIYYW